MSKPYQGHRSYNAWNVSLHLHQTEPLYRMMQEAVRTTRTRDDAADRVAHMLAGQKTPDGVPYTRTNIRLAMRWLTA